MTSDAGRRTPTLQGGEYVRRMSDCVHWTSDESGGTPYCRNPKGNDPTDCCMVCPRRGDCPVRCAVMRR